MAPEYTIREFWPVDAESFPEFAALGVDKMKVPAPAFTALCGVEPIACAGILPIRPGIGEAWATFRRPLNGHRVYLARAVREALDGLIARGDFRRVQAIIAPGRPDLERWMAFLGFHIEGTLCAYGLDGGDCLLYARIRGT